MLRIAVQSKGRLFDDTMNLLAEADIKVSASKRTLLVQMCIRDRAPSIDSSSGRGYLLLL